MASGEGDGPASLPVFAKVCTSCWTRKWAEEFSPNSRNPDGMQTQCKDCRTAWFRRYREEHPERHAATQARAYLRRKARRSAPDGAPRRRSA